MFFDVQQPLGNSVLFLSYMFIDLKQPLENSVS